MDWKIKELDVSTPDDSVWEEIHAVLNKDIDALILRNAFTLEEREKITSGLSKLSSKYFVQMDGGVFLPLVFAAAEEFHPSENFKSYFDYMDFFRSLFPEIFEMDFEKKLHHLFDRNGKNVLPVPGPDSLNYYLPFSIRMLFPESGGLPRHLDEQFLTVNPIHSEHLKSLLDYPNCASYLFVISEPKQGGELTFFDDDITMKLAINGGDGIVFASKRIEHAVSSPKGPLNRISLGGWLGREMNGERLYIWS